MRFVSWLSLAAFLATSIPTALHAEAPTTPTDVVLFERGGMLRGTISESDPEGDVVIVLVTGETRRVPMKEVKYAGPAHEAPRAEVPPSLPPAPPASPAPTKDEVRPLVTVSGEAAPVRVVANEPDITFYLRAGEATGKSAGLGQSWTTVAVSYDRICTAPCEANIARGTYRLALQRGTSSRMAVRDPVTISGPATINGTVISHKTTRTIGGLTLLGGVGLGTGLMVHSGGPNEGNTEFAIGVVSALVGTMVGLALASIADEARVKVTPLATGSSSTLLASADTAWSRRLGLEGIAVRAQF